ncbi:MAG TPA: PIN domain-containing protein [Thermoanaerobaculia bacterium]|nr:PIN domain-containing protein [Thermoanaerobaculia bacterium]
MTGAEKLFVDTNILVYATHSRSPWHQQALESLDDARERGVELVLSPQILREYLAVTTRNLPASDPRRAHLLENVSIFQQEFRIAEENLAVSVQLIHLVEAYRVSGKQVHDANIVSSMLTQGIERILTNNEDDFARFRKLIRVLPLAS